MQAHHLKPRLEGGKNQMRYLISLCVACHDIAEEGTLTRKEILSYYVRSERNKKDDAPVVVNSKYALDGDWHKVVYGGYKKLPVK